MARVLISAAHTLMAPGEIFQDLREVDLTRKIVAKAIPYLEKSGLTFQTVPLDLQLLNRIDWINGTGYSEAAGDIFVEIHINDGGKRGFEAWFSGAPGPNNKSQKLAEYLVDEISKTTGYQKQGVRSEFEHTLGSLLILNQTNPIATAIECLYIDNPEDIAILKDEAKLDSLAKSIVDAVTKYVKEGPGSIKLEPTAATTPVEAPNPSFANTNMFRNPTGGSALSPQMAQPAGISPGLEGFNSAPQPVGSSSNQNLMMDRDQRKKMVLDIYKKLLGKEPNPRDLESHLNFGDSEDKILRKITDSKEFEQMVKDASEVKELKEKLVKQEAELVNLKSSVMDLKAMQDSMNKLLAHKNLLIARMQQELLARNIILPGQYFDPRAQQPPVK